MYIRSKKQLFEPILSTYGCYNVMELWIPTKLLVVTYIPQVIFHPNENCPQIHWIRGSFYYPSELSNSEMWNCTDTGLLSKLHLVLNRALKPRKETLIIGVFIVQFAELCAFWKTAQVNRDINVVLTVFHRNYVSKYYLCEDVLIFKGGACSNEMIPM